MAAVTEKKGGAAMAVAACGPGEDCAKKAVAALPASGEETHGKCFKKRLGEEATFMETAKDYFTQFKDSSAKTHWICMTNRVRAAGEYVSQKSSSVFSKHKVEPVVKDGSTPEVVDKPAAAKSH